MNKQYKEKSFNIPKLDGISEKTMDTHLKLYAGYVSHTNIILDLVNKSQTGGDNPYALKEARRRLGFEFDGMKNHELFFEQLEEGAKQRKDDSSLSQKIEGDFGSFGAWLEDFTQIAQTRGIGWAILYYDKEQDRLINAWVDEQHFGHLTNARFVLGLDMWEHAYLNDYAPSAKADYVNAFFKNLNWKVVEDRYEKITS